MNGLETSRNDTERVVASEILSASAATSAMTTAPTIAPTLPILPIPLKVFACSHCATTYFPGRSLCAACGSADFVEVDGEQGWIEQWTELRQSVYKPRPGEHLAEPQVRHYLATVRTAAGPLVIAAMEEAGAAGMAVGLCHEGARLIARRKVLV